MLAKGKMMEREKKTNISSINLRLAWLPSWLAAQDVLRLPEQTINQLKSRGYHGAAYVLHPCSLQQIN